MYSMNLGRFDWYTDEDDQTKSTFYQNEVAYVICPCLELLINSIFIHHAYICLLSSTDVPPLCYVQ